MCGFVMQMRQPYASATQPYATNCLLAFGLTPLLFNRLLGVCTELVWLHCDGLLIKARLKHAYYIVTRILWCSVSIFYFGLVASFSVI